MSGNDPLATEVLRVERRDGVSIVTLDRPDARNALSRALRDSISAAFRGLQADPETRVVILTGTGDTFSGPAPDPDANRASHKMTPDEWGELGWEANNFHVNLLASDVPMISAVNGPAARHAELPVMCDIVLASENATFQDSAHFVGGLVPGDGVHVVFPMIMGLNRGRYLLLTGQVLDASEALEAGLVNEVLPRKKLLPRAWELARQMMQQPEMNRRYARLLLTEQLRRQINELLPYGLALEGLAITREVD